jgi:hypothetical protein
MMKKRPKPNPRSRSDKRNRLNQGRQCFMLQCPRHSQDSEWNSMSLVLHWTVCCCQRQSDMTSSDCTSCPDVRRLDGTGCKTRDGAPLHTEKWGLFYFRRERPKIID